MEFRAYSIRDETGFAKILIAKDPQLRFPCGALLLSMFFDDAAPDTASNDTSEKMPTPRW
jgi:hypothetical protein